MSDLGEVVAQVITLLGGVALITSAITWLAKKALDSFMAGRLEAYKANLQSEVDEFKANLERTNKEHAVRFERFHARRAEVIDAIFAVLSGIEPIMRIATDKDTSAEQFSNALNALAQAMPELLKIYEPKRIYLPKEMSDRIAKMNKSLRHAVASLLAARNMANTPMIRGSRQIAEHFNNELEAARATHVELQALVQDLEDEFRAIVGDP